VTLDEWYKTARAALLKTARLCAEEAGQWARDNSEQPRLGTAKHEKGSAPERWFHHSGGAHDNLVGDVRDHGNDISFYVAQGVEYGKWLETVHDGKYGICGRAVEHFIPEYNQWVDEFNRMKPPS
jgi:hypothetical protein